MKKIFFILFAIAIVASCKKKAAVQESPEMVKTPEDFQVFYESFHKDTAYQAKHIQFPLQGLPMDVDSATLADRDYYYTQDIWEYHKPVDFSKGEFLQTLSILGNRMIIERIQKSDNSYAVERRFAKMSDDQWYLIYYIAPNRFSKIQ